MQGNGSGRGRTAAILVAVMLAGGGLVTLTPRASAFPPSLSVTPGLYGHAGLPLYPYLYVPGEAVSLTLSSDTAGEVYDIAVIIVPPRLILQAYNDITIPGSLSVTLTYVVPPALPDGASYAIDVGDSNYIESNLVSTRYARQRFAVQAYEVAVTTDRPAYIGGDTVRVTWSATNLRDGSPAPDGFGQLWAYDTSPSRAPLISPSPNPFVTASGSFPFKLGDPSDPRYDGVVMVWFNDTASNPTRFQQAFASFFISDLGVYVVVPAATYAPSDLVCASIRTVARETANPPSPTDPPEPGMVVDITVWDVTGTPVLLPGYGAANLVTDAQGNLSYPFVLGSNIAEGSLLQIQVNASNPSGILLRIATATFNVSASGGFRLSLSFDRAVYRPGASVGVHYRLAPRSAWVVVPPAFALEFGLVGGSRSRANVANAEGNVTYVLPASLADGPHPLSMTDCMTGAIAQGSVTSDGTPPAAGSPAIVGPSYTGTDLVVHATVLDASGVASVVLHWRFSDGINGTVTMTPIGGNVFAAAVPARPAPGTLELSLAATDKAGNSASTPWEPFAVTANPSPPATWVAAPIALGAVALAAVLLILAVRRRRRGRARDSGTGPGGGSNPPPLRP